MQPTWASTNPCSGFHARRQFFCSNIMMVTSEARFPGLPLLPPQQDRDEYLDVHALVKKPELRGLLHTLSIRQAESGQGHFRLFRTLEIGHQVYPGHQRVNCSPFETYYGANRQDFVFVRPPEAAAEGLHLRTTMSCIARCCFCLTWRRK